MLEDIGEALRKGTELSKAVSDALLECQIAVSSGHGIGKSALVAMITCWAMATCPDTRGVITAETEGQLSTKTQPEIAKWARAMICAHWFEVKATKMFAIERPESWRIDFIPWNESNPVAFQGLHNLERRILVIFDEASKIARVIWETIRGALTDVDTEIIWAVFGNPTEVDGEFFECFGRNKHRWIRRQIDSRSVPITNKEKIQQYLDDFGEDSDFFRVRVRGVFPRGGFNTLITMEAVAAARVRAPLARSPCIIGVDPARFGEDQTVIAIREGDRLHPLLKRRQIDTMMTAGLVSDMIIRWEPEAVMVDEVGIGAGVVDRLRQLGHKMVHGFHTWGQKGPADDKTLYANKLTEMWARMAAWVERTAMLPDDNDLEKQLTSRKYGFEGSNRWIIETKAAFKERGFESPDESDAVAMTFALKLPPADILQARRKAAKEKAARRRGGDAFDEFDL